ncbi:hypothetical protein BT96DRAFT_385217 [Gymnopus androsaceus JB14]|uniref:Uncharacterized protein n=1 Tax=Gymnopus androsaceus JB14 TaxID=1447944 RepID=A0A6A4I4T3_9AGAR|nr:hypothetical protein BT96DRAFT_385217 [Gymnopus androsaceus JB14]
MLLLRAHTYGNHASIYRRVNENHDLRKIWTGRKNYTVFLLAHSKTYPQGPHDDGFLHWTANLLRQYVSNWRSLSPQSSCLSVDRPGTTMLSHCSASRCQGQLTRCSRQTGTRTNVADRKRDHLHEYVQFVSQLSSLRLYHRCTTSLSSASRSL